jgi:hypothetical protein
MELANPVVTIPVTLVGVTLLNGQQFTASIRPDRGDNLTEDDHHLTLVQQGETTRILVSQIAVLSRRDTSITVPAGPDGKPLPAGAVVPMRKR